MPDIKKLREICEKASPGPWKAVASRTAIGVCYRIFPESWGKVPDHGGICAYDDYTSLNPHPKGEQAANAQFIAAARTALPELLDEVERLMKDRALDIDWYVDGLENMAKSFAFKALQARKALRLACVKLADYVDKVPTLENKDNVPETVAECWELYFLEKVRGKGG